MVILVLLVQPAQLVLAVKLAQPDLAVQSVQMALKADRATQGLVVRQGKQGLAVTQAQLAKLDLAVRREHVVLLETRVQLAKWVQLAHKVLLVLSE